MTVSTEYIVAFYIVLGFGLFVSSVMYGYSRGKLDGLLRGIELGKEQARKEKEGGR